MRTFVGELIHANLLRGEGLIQIKKVQGGWPQLPELGRKHRWLQRREGGLKLGLNQPELLVFHLAKEGKKTAGNTPVSTGQLVPEPTGPGPLTSKSA